MKKTNTEILWYYLTNSPFVTGLVIGALLSLILLVILLHHFLKINKEQENDTM